MANKMNAGLLEGSCWRGRFLMSFASTSATDPKVSQHFPTIPTLLAHQIQNQCTSRTSDLQLQSPIRSHRRR
jgi:hypothetical protein